MMPIYERLAELWFIRRVRPFSAQEQADFEHCLAVNASHISRLSGLYNLSLLASMTEDKDWQHEICREIEKIEGKEIPE
ncbi:hypothetical protein D3H35_21785 [Cohnella faecalis]|uniref:Uncharacterized protein n=2 Tax=Cohnella faecalis TaxID=2315694 RepID=A0A398CP38_9BACL|nr:hypothetical protein D3H35_21735 [Cohnella faecalis]RIE01647.1 hypothetical protein D3H35_21785 [Cohnella faecalis]